MLSENTSPNATDHAGLPWESYFAKKASDPNAVQFAPPKFPVPVKLPPRKMLPEASNAIQVTRSSPDPPKRLDQTGMPVGASLTRKMSQPTPALVNEPPPILT